MNAEFWHKKRVGNVDRDACAIRALAGQGWHALVTWECEIRDSNTLAQRLVAFLESQ